MQMYAAEAYGTAEAYRFDRYTVTMTHADAVDRDARRAGNQINAHFTSPPFHQREIKDPRVRTVLNTDDIMGGATTFTMLSTTARYREANPAAYKAVIAALEEANELIRSDPQAAARDPVRGGSPPPASRSTSSSRCCAIPTSASRRRPRTPRNTPSSCKRSARSRTGPRRGATCSSPKFTARTAPETTSERDPVCMTAAHEQRVIELCGAALRRPAADRLAFIARETAGDLELQRAVEARLARTDDTTMREAGAEITLGTTIGPYRIDALLGAGGMGIVYRATDARLNRPVAIKFLASTVLDGAARERFWREAQMASALNHPNILTVFDVGEHEGSSYLVTELVDGGTADDWCRPAAPAPRPTWRQVVDLLIGVADGLAAAHEASILHRDVKPANVLVSRSGHAKLADFGLAKLAADPQTATPGRALTRSGMIIGTLEYMSPEQALGKPLDQRSDIFSFGVLLYELLTGRRPFGGATELDRLQAIVDAAATPLPPELPDALRAIVEKALEREPADRYQSMRDLVVDLRRVARRTSPLPPTARLFHTATAQRAAWLGAAVLVLAGGGWWSWHRTGNALPEASIGPFDTLTPVTSFPGTEISPSFAPDGERLTFAWTGDSVRNWDIYVTQLGTATALRLTTDSATDWFPRWSPDGSQIAFFRRRGEATGGELMVIPALGGRERRLTELRFSTTERVLQRSVLAWTPDSRRIVFSSSDATSNVYHLHAITLATGTVEKLALDGGPILGDLSPLVSPDGRWLAFTRFLSGPTVGQVMAQRLRSTADGSLALDGEPIAVTTPGFSPQAVAWSPSSTSLVLVENSALREWLVGSPGAIRPIYTATTGIDSATLAWQGGRARAVASLLSLDTDLFHVTLDTETHGPTDMPLRISGSTLGEDQPRLSPDGKTLAFTSARSGSAELWLADIDGANPRQLTRLGSRIIGYPDWSPDGKRIAFHARIADRYNNEPRLYFVDVDGSGVAQQFGDERLGALGLSQPAWSADGEHVFASTTGGGDRVFRVRIADGFAEPLFDGDSPRPNAAGDRLFYIKARELGIFSRSLAGDVSSNPETLVASDYRPLAPWWNVDDGIFYAVAGADGSNRVRFVDTASGEATDVFTTPTEMLGMFVSSDGTQLVWSAIPAESGGDLARLDFGIATGD